MTIFVALFFTIPISFALSTALVATTSRSLHAALEETADGDESVAYWVPFSIAITYLVPLFVGLVLGVGSVPVAGVDPAAGFARILASTVGGCLIALVGIGLQLSKHNQRMMHMRRTQQARRSARNGRDFD